MTEDNKVTDKKTLTQNDKGVTMKENPDTSAAQVSIAPTLKSPLSLSHLCVRVQLESYKRKTSCIILRLEGFLWTLVSLLSVCLCVKYLLKDLVFRTHFKR